MRHDIAQHALAHMSRRKALKTIGAAGAAAAVATNLGTFANAGAQAPSSGAPSSGAPTSGKPDTSNFNDDMFDWEAVISGAWAPGPYGADDQRGTYNEVTAASTAAALSMLDPTKPVKTYNLGAEMFNGFPAFPSEPPRLHDMFLYVLGNKMPDDFTAGGGIQASLDPIGANLVAANEERFAENFTLQIATQIDGLNHVGVGPIFYNGNDIREIGTPTGTSRLGNENMGPIVTTGHIIDVLGLKVEQGASDTFFTAPNGNPSLNGDYRVTVEDIESAMRRQNAHTSDINKGDVVLYHTGWHELHKDDPDTYLGAEPGPWLAETKFMASKKPAIVGSDTWGYEVLAHPLNDDGIAFPCHQILLVKEGIRIGESILTTELVNDGVYKFVFMSSPENIPGATCASTPPVGLANA